MIHNTTTMVTYIVTMVTYYNDCCNMTMVLQPQLSTSEPERN